MKNKYLTKIGILLFLCFLSSQWIFAQTESEILNSKGYEFYLVKDYSNAAVYFKKSIDSDNNNFIAHHNYACVLALVSGDLNTIIYHLQNEVNISGQRMEKILADSDLDTVRTKPMFLNFLLGNLYEKEFTAVKPAPGSCAPGYEIHFFMDGTLEYTEIMEGLYGDQPVGEPFWGRWAVVNNKMVLYIPDYKNMLSVKTFELPSDGFLWGIIGYDETGKGIQIKKWEF